MEEYRGHVSRLPIVGVMGSGRADFEGRGRALGERLAGLPVHLLTGGGGGVMAAVSRAFAGIPNREGQVLGVLPARPGDPQCRPPEGYPNPWVEIALRTHLPLSGERGTELGSRNHLNVLSADLVVVLPGSGGTASEARLALRYGRPVIAWASREEMPELPAEIRNAASLDEVMVFVDRRARQVQADSGSE